MIYLDIITTWRKWSQIYNSSESIKMFCYFHVMSTRTAAIRFEKFSAIQL